MNSGTELKERTSNKLENKKLNNYEISFPKNKEDLYKNKDQSTMSKEKHKHKNEKLEQNTQHNTEIQKLSRRSKSSGCNLCIIDKYFEKKIFAAYDYVCRRCPKNNPNEKFSKMKACRRICLLFIPPILFILFSFSATLLSTTLYTYTIFFSLGSMLMFPILLKIIIYSSLASRNRSNKISK
ncbi:Plasmodium exported protein (Pm-fam-a like), unknown function [Plasmodium ovale wallikeri]|uniref:Uncharacterized protein n=1 Tax=Plasmodium ovale wallikeri TaxID=864142 RepID=A0A1A9AGU7_PLAOA|nr:Plasmodium exported protein (Pm-fam-a like), unknown function [Plasmodium ovale wallikeri]